MKPTTAAAPTRTATIPNSGRRLRVAGAGRSSLTASILSADADPSVVCGGGFSPVAG